MRIFYYIFFQMYFKLDSWRWLLCRSSCSCLHLKKMILYFLTYIFFVVFAATDVFMDLNMAPTPLPLYYWAHCRKPWGQKQSGACLHMIPTYKYETCTNWIVFSRLPQELIASFCHITPSLAALPGAFLRHHQAISACVTELLQTRFNVYMCYIRRVLEHSRCWTHTDPRSKRRPAQRVDSDTPPVTHRLLFRFQSTPTGG